MELSSQIITVLDDLCRRFGIVVDWASENIAPYLEDLAEKLVVFEVATSWFWIILIASVTLLSWIGFAIFAIVCGLYDDVPTVFLVISILLTFITIIMTGTQIYDIITCEVFPEKILFREIKELLQSAKNY